MSEACEYENEYKFIDESISKEETIYWLSIFPGSLEIEGVAFATV